MQIWGSGKTNGHHIRRAYLAQVYHVLVLILKSLLTDIFFFNMGSRGFKLIILRFTKGSFSMLFSLTLFLYRMIPCSVGIPFIHWGHLHNRRREYKAFSHSFPLPIQNKPNILCNCKWKIGKVILVKRFTDHLTLAK